MNRGDIHEQIRREVEKQVKEQVDLQMKEFILVPFAQQAKDYEEQIKHTKIALANS